MKRPSINTEKLAKAIKGLIDIIPIRDMYEIVMKSIDRAMDDLVDIREEADESKSDVKRLTDKWDEQFAAFGEREAHYYKAFLEAEDREIVDAPLFKGNYDGFDFERVPKWPDIETPWRLANELVDIVIASGGKQDDLDDLQQRFTKSIALFWSEARELLSEEQKKYAEEAGEDVEGRLYGFWPAVALTAVAAVGLLGSAIGYSKGKERVADEYVDQRSVYKRGADIGLGVGIGAVLTLLLVSRMKRT